MTELSEEIEVITPGQMLREGREAKGLNHGQVASKLNLKADVIKAIEANQFEQVDSVTFLRGYLRAYARLVDVPQDDVFQAYEYLGNAKQQYAEMQSFSRRTKKQASDNRLMWSTYVILLTIVGMSVWVWWKNQPATPDIEVVPEAEIAVVEQAELVIAESAPQQVEVAVEETPQQIEVTQAEENPPLAEPQTAEAVAVVAAPVRKPQPVLDSLLMNFSGSCWVNVIDATGERVAYGTKRAGKVMPLKGKAPFKITLGAPEVVTISFNGQNFDMTRFKPGQIAKFTIPMSEQ